MGKVIDIWFVYLEARKINHCSLQGEKGKYYPQSLMYCIARDGNQLLYILILLICVLLRIRSGFAVALFVTCNTISIVLKNIILKNDYGIIFLISVI